MSLLNLWFLFVFLPGLNGLSVMALFILAILLLVCFISTLASEGEAWEYIVETFKKFKYIFVALCSIVILGLFIPSERQVAVLVGGHVVTNIESVQELPENIINAANRYLKYLEEESANE